MTERVTYTKEEQAANREKWVAALRSGEYQQTTKVLKDGDGYCCLGVACDLAVGAGLGSWYGDDFYEADGGDRSHQVLTRDVRDWLGLKYPSGDLTGRPTEGGRCLTDLNDQAGYSFAQIADVIEQGKVEVQ